ncbi:urate oxidase [bacterium]|nr:urate oxidase [bacterium]MBP9809962.1 urate oxidase [bacterium]
MSSPETKSSANSRTKSSIKSSVLVHNAYGKSGVRLTKVIRHEGYQELKELTANIQLEGSFEGSYLEGDNSQIIATDSMKNTVYVMAAEHALANLESFAQDLALHFLKTYSHVSEATVHLVEDLWLRIPTDGKPHPHAFVSAGNEKRIASVVADRESLSLQSGIDNLVVAKTTDSQFWGFIRDQYTTLPEVRDRIMATSIEASWWYTAESKKDTESIDFNKNYETIRKTILDVFATQHSLAVQQTLYDMGEAVLAAVSDIEKISITMPNQHRIAFNLEPFGKNNQNEIFFPIDEPFGLISGTIKRGA